MSEPRACGATFSPCRNYRYDLWRWFDLSPGKKYAMFIGLNPSTADETKDDPTVRRCISFALDWGYGGLCMTNIFAFRATDPREMMREVSPVGMANDNYLLRHALGAGVVVAAWGVHGEHMDRGHRVRAMIDNLHYLRLTRDGHPAHPLYLPKTLKPTIWV